MAARPASIKVRALQWLAQREHSRDELRGKLLRLLRRGVDAAKDGAVTAEDAEEAADPVAEVDALLVWLEAQGHLSSSRFIESRVHARQSRYGNLRIRQELKQHGLTLDAPSQQALQCSEFGRALAVWRKEFAAPAADASARLRQMRFLAGRGFSMDVVQRVVRQGTGAFDEPDEHDDRPV